MASAYYQRRLMKAVISHLRHLRQLAKSKRRFNRNVRKISKLFSMKVLLKAWKNVRGEERISHAIKRGAPLTYCVKYSEYCRCVSCMAEKQAQMDIVPQRQVTYHESNKESLNKLTCKTLPSTQELQQESSRVLPLSKLYTASGEMLPTATSMGYFGLQAVPLSTRQNGSSSSG